MSDLDAAALASVREYYSNKIVEYGPEPRGVDWGSSERQLNRFRQLTRDMGDGPFSLLDLGCGYGGLWDYLIAQGKSFRYVGLDISEEMISRAKAIHPNSPNCTFDVGSRPLQGFDHVVASGIFNVMANVPRQAWDAHVRATVVARFTACE
jgi:cyclopropane fatty-acyl-phospholipid synthase-like methyltransferase